MAAFYHYTTEAALAGILKTGVYSNHPYYTTVLFENASEAGQAVGVMPHYIEVVLLFKDDGLFKLFNQGTVPATGRFSGGAPQYQHPFRLKPIAKRKIKEQVWTKV